MRLVIELAPDADSEGVMAYLFKKTSLGRSYTFNMVAIADGRAFPGAEDDALGEAGTWVLTSAIDNLLKGAAGQALQCLNLMLGFEEAEGLR